MFILLILFKSIKTKRFWKTILDIKFIKTDIRKKSSVENKRIQLKPSLSTVLYIVLLNKINIALKVRSTAISHKSILNLQYKQQKILNSKIKYTPKEVVHKFSLCFCHKKNHEAFSYGLGHHIPFEVTKTSVNTWFKSFYQILLLDISTNP